MVAERELKLRQALNVAGLRDAAFWVSWIVWTVIVAALTALFICVVCLCFQFTMFKTNENWSLLLAIFFQFTCCMTTVAFVFSTILTKTNAALMIGLLMFVFGFITLIASSFILTKSIQDSARWITILTALLPWCPWNKCISLIGTQSEGDRGGYSWKDIGNDFNGEEPFHVKNCMNWLIFDYFFWLVIALYLDNILPQSGTLRKTNPFFCCMPSYWCGKGKIASSDGQAEMPPPSENPDVKREEEYTLATASQSADFAVQVLTLRKNFRQFQAPCCTCCCDICSCCKSIARNTIFQAVKGNSFSIPKSQLFCLLGPNGAGKTTTINCLTGVLPIDSGDARVYTESINDHQGMINIRALMGVCPQFDMLWDKLTADEHMELFGAVKGLERSVIEEEKNALLTKVKLKGQKTGVDPSTIQAGFYSGGMRRRLSVAIAMLGSPKIVYLDEPTTGMDPISRGYVWQIVEQFKTGRAIVLTTHSMEEADILGDRIAIIARGRMRVIGTSTHLKQQHGKGYRISLGVKDDESLNRSWVAINEMMCSRFNAAFEKRTGTRYIDYTVARNYEATLPALFAELDKRKDELGIIDVNLGMVTLEDVFLAIAKQAEIDEAKDTDTVSLTLDNNAIYHLYIKTLPADGIIKLGQSESAQAPVGVFVAVQVGLSAETGKMLVLGHQLVAPPIDPSTGQVQPRPEARWQPGTGSR